MATIFVVFYFYQIGYLLLGLWKRHTKETDVSHALHRYAAVISARNEANVIGGLIASLKAQDYPSELLDIYVIADNCTDNTAQVALSLIHIFQQKKLLFYGNVWVQDLDRNRCSKQKRGRLSLIHI